MINYLECVCKPINDLIIDPTIIASELFCQNLLDNVNDRLFEVDFKSLMQADGQAKYVRAKFVKVIDVDCLCLECAEDSLQIVLFRKKTFDKCDKYLIGHLLQGILFTSINKYIVAITEDIDRWASVTVREGVKIKKISEREFVSIQKHLIGVQYMCDNILPNIEGYKKLYARENNLPMQYCKSNLYNKKCLIDDFVVFLKRIVKNNVDKRLSSYN